MAVGPGWRVPALITLVGVLPTSTACTRPATAVAAPSESHAWVRDVRCPVLLYHRVTDRPPDSHPDRARLYCSRDRFLEHLVALERTGHETITLEELDAGLVDRRALPARPVVLTFDDGTEDHWAVSRILARRGMKGVFFVSPSLCGKPGHLTRGQVRALGTAGMEIGNHTRTHAVLRELTWEEKVTEVVTAQRELEELLGAPVVSFAYPGGVFDPESIQLLRRCGLRFARTTLSGVAVTGVPNLQLPSVHAHEETTGRELARLLFSGPEPCRVCRTAAMPPRAAGS